MASQSAPRIAAIATAVPPHRLEQADVARRAAALFGDGIADFDRFLPVYQNAAIETRYSCVPAAWYGERHGFGARNDLFLRHAVDLLEQVTIELLTGAALAIVDIDALVVVSTSGIATPSLDARLMERLAFRRDVARLPVFGLGCAGGVTGLARAAQLARAAPGTTILCLVVELCGLTFRSTDRSKSNVIATALFGDGAAGAIVRAAGDGPAAAGPAIVGGGEYTWPNSLDVMGWEVGDDGLAVVFSRDIPHLVRTRLPAAAAHVLASLGLTPADIDAHLCHPGGAKVIDALEAAYGCAPGAMRHARRVLRDFGNMSAATVLFVLADAIADGLRGRTLLSALGPGFTASFAVLEAP